MLRLKCIVEQPTLDVYYRVLAVDKVKITDNIIYARPYELKYIDKETQTYKQYGVLAYPKYAWKLF